MELQKANAGLKPGTDDLIYAGNITKWEKFGNSLKVKVAKSPK